jgi:acetyl-CoA C-acetyltransferase
MSTENMPVLLDGIRTAFGRYRGALAQTSSRQLKAAVIRALLERQPELARCDGVLLGQVIQAAQGQNPARLAAADGGVNLSVPAMTLNNVCLAGLASVSDASRRIRAGEGSAYIVGGGDSMSRGPHAAVIRDGVARPSNVEFIDTTLSDGLWCSLGNEGMGELSERVNAELGIGRERQDEIAYRSQHLAAKATNSGILAIEMAGVSIEGANLSQDEGIRADSSVEKLAKLQPAFVAGGTITAGNSSQMSDGASIGAVTSMAVAERWGRKPLARIVGFAEIAGPDNSLHLKPAMAIERAVALSGLKISDIDLFEINEAFAAVVAASCDSLSIPLDVVNVNGGAIAVGHPLGGTGFRLLLTLAHELNRRQGRYGVASLCGGGGQGYAVLIERIN